MSRSTSGAPTPTAQSGLGSCLAIYCAKAMSMNNNETASDAVKRLQRGLLRIAFSFRGHSDNYDNHLKMLGQEIRNDRDPTRLTDLIEDTVVRIESIMDSGQVNEDETLLRLVRGLRSGRGSNVPATDGHHEHAFRD